MTQDEALAVVEEILSRCGDKFLADEELDSKGRTALMFFLEPRRVGARKTWPIDELRNPK